MVTQNLPLLQAITAPFANTSEHVQGPGGNTSIKKDGLLLIKASGFTFADVANNSGVVALNNQQIVDKLSRITGDEVVYENAPPQIVESIPAGVKPSMEFEFHSLLDDYVLHTHSVYVNVVACSQECEKILAEIFSSEEYLLLPYATPGFPIAAALLSTNLKRWPSVIFLKNHGIIVHGNKADEIVERYSYVENKIKGYLKLQVMPELQINQLDNGNYAIESKNIYGFKGDLMKLKQDLVEDILIPDQSIFFRNKISFDPTVPTEIFIDVPSSRLIIKGSDRFLASAKAMLQAVFYIKSNIAALNYNPDFIGTEKLDILHGLSTEKYRLAILKN